MRRPHDGQTRRRFLNSSALFCRPAMIISQPIASVATARVAMCGAKVILLPLSRSEFVKPFSSCERGGALGNTTRDGDDRIRAYRARWWPDLRVRAFLELSGDRPRLPADVWRKSGAEGA